MRSTVGMLVLAVAALVGIYGCMTSVRDLPPVVVADVTCKDGMVHVDASGSHDADDIGDPGIVEMVITAVPGDVVWTGTDLEVDFPRSDAQSVLVMVRDNEGTANTSSYLIPDCETTILAPCENQPPEVVATITWYCDTESICVDARASRDVDGTVKAMEVSIRAGGSEVSLGKQETFTICFRVPKDECGNFILEGFIDIVVWDDDGTQGESTASWWWDGQAFRFKEVIAP